MYCVRLWDSDSLTVDESTDMVHGQVGEYSGKKEISFDFKLKLH